MICATALALRPVSPPLAPFGLVADLVALDQVLMALEHGHATDRGLDAEIYEAMGWQVQRTPLPRSHGAARYARRIAWRARSPLSTAWLPLPSPTGDRAASVSLVPHGWHYGSGVRDGGAVGWVRERRTRPGRVGPEFFEMNRVTEPRALSSAALFAQRFLAREGIGHG